MPLERASALPQHHMRRDRLDKGLGTLGRSLFVKRPFPHVFHDTGSVSTTIALVYIRRLRSPTAFEDATYQAAAAHIDV